jgi:hypothetical protein
MDLQHVLAELLTLAQAYPNSVKVVVQTPDFKYNIAGVEVTSVHESIEIALKVE